MTRPPDGRRLASRSRHRPADRQLDGNDRSTPSFRIAVACASRGYVESRVEARRRETFPRPRADAAAVIDWCKTIAVRRALVNFVLITIPIFTILVPPNANPRFVQTTKIATYIFLRPGENFIQDCIWEKLFDNFYGKFRDENYREIW